MSIVLPGKKNKNDIFAPRKALQDAQNKIGHAYFDPTVLECSRNAVELTKLVSAWEDIEKEKVRILRSLDREQEQLRRSLKRNLRRHDDDGTFRNDITASNEAIETVDGKAVPPGFRFRSNGEIKNVSQMTLPLADLDVGSADCSEDDSDPEFDRVFCKRTIHHRRLDRVNSSLPGTSREHSGPIDYATAIEELQLVIDDLVNELVKSQRKLSKSTLGNTYLRGHSRDSIAVKEYAKREEQKSPNDRFAFKPGASNREDLHRKRVNTPTHRTCTGCMFKLKQESDDLDRIRKSREAKSNVKRQWSYVPRGKYVESTTTLEPSPETSVTNIKAGTSCGRRRSLASTASGFVAEDRKQSGKFRNTSAVHFKTDYSEETPENGGKRMSSAPSTFKSHARIKSSSDVLRRHSTTLQSSRSLSSAHGDLQRTASLPANLAGRNSSLSSRASLGSVRANSRSTLAFETRMKILKAFQVHL